MDELSSAQLSVLPLRISGRPAANQRRQWALHREVPVRRPTVHHHLRSVQLLIKRASESVPAVMRRTG